MVGGCFVALLKPAGVVTCQDLPGDGSVARCQGTVLDARGWFCGRRLSADLGDG